MSKKILTLLLVICAMLCFKNVAMARDFIDYRNEITFDIKDSYEMIKADEKLYGFQNEEYKVVYNVIENGQITDVLDFASFNEVTDKKVIDTINNMGLNPLNSTVEVKMSLDFSKVANFKAKSGEKDSHKTIYYHNNKFYIFQIVTLGDEIITKEQYLLEMQMISTSIKELTKEQKDRKKKGKEDNFYFEEIKENSKESKIDKKGTVNEEYKPVLKVIIQYFSAILHVNVTVIMYLIGNIIAIVLLRRFAVIYEYSYIKYPVGIVLGYFGYKVCENFFYSMDFEMSKPTIIICITIILCLVLIPKKYRKSTSKYKEEKSSIKEMKKIDKSEKNTNNEKQDNKKNN